MSILLYENDLLLNSILHYQITNYENFNVSISENPQSLFKIASEKKIDIFILNLDYLENDLETFLEIFQIKNKNSNIVGYYENIFNKNDHNFFLLKKPALFNLKVGHIFCRYLALTPSSFKDKASFKATFQTKSYFFKE